MRTQTHVNTRQHMHARTPTHMHTRMHVCAPTHTHFNIHLNSSSRNPHQPLTCVYVFRAWLCLCPRLSAPFTQGATAHMVADRFFDCMIALSFHVYLCMDVSPR